MRVRIIDHRFSKIDAVAIFASHVQIAFGPVFADGLVVFRNNGNGILLLKQFVNSVFVKIIK
jgi:hypothetical protein